ncbi:MAG: MBL fold metallo-hydrolase [Planctomycetes bacterium]|nr:MBL fold metallo-hydrolase [Planctomycetota bacterium]
MRRLLLIWSLCVTAMGLSATAIADQRDGRLDIYFIDVEGGAATLMITPVGESLLIDSGYPDNAGRDRDRILKVLRDVTKQDHLDHAAVTHWHLDHYGNHAALASQIKIHNFWDRGIPEKLAEDNGFEKRIVDYRAASQNKSKTMKPGDLLPLKADGKTPLSLKIVTASRAVIPNTGEPNPFADDFKTPEVDPTDNAASVSFLTKFGKFSFLCCGDLTHQIEKKLMTPNNPLGKVELFMVTHHGLGVSNHPAFVLAIDPRVCVMCNGPTKGCDPSTNATLRQIKSLQAIYQLHRNVKLKADEQTPAEFIANNVDDTASCKGVFVKASVAPGGESYTVQIGSDGAKREFKTR